MRRGFKRFGSLIISITLFIILFDQITKRLVQTKMHLFQSIPVIPKVLHFTFIINTGAAFGILKGKQGFFFFTTILAVILIFSFIKDLKDDNVWGAVSLSLILGGALGNFIDRIFYGYVVDFIELKINWPIFNIADMSIVIGIMLMFVEGYINKKRLKNAASSSEDR